MAHTEVDARRLPPASIIEGAAGGVVGAMAMTGTRELARGLGLIAQTPPEAILQKEVPQLLNRIPEERRVATIQLAHWAYGACAGAAYGLTPIRLRDHRLSGPVYGVLSWAFFEFALAPALGLAHAHESRPRARAALFADHVLYGLILGASPRRRLLRKR
ncbi:hypothetical protein F4561_005911 [Lipingzhangella halophila]|uniref:DUF1440 domain-containing protein n=1 Tax=Lipingzhangella halophila TaxID=1783352 RepID=A0A7W7RNK1_9ACTN|nr:hypothetical protein [Lipingzhangella halophila]MBB4935017.1 hypothetical protein [Lipingzhangella halophila]